MVGGVVVAVVAVGGQLHLVAAVDLELALDELELVVGGLERAVVGELQAALHDLVGAHALARLALDGAVEGLVLAGDGVDVDVVGQGRVGGVERLAGVARRHLDGGGGDNQSRLASFNHFELICNVGARRFLKNAHPRIVYGALIRPHVGALCKRLYARNRIATHVKSGNSKPSIALFRSTVGFLRFIAEKLDGDDALPLRDKRNVAIRHNHAGNTSRINVSRIFIFPSRKDIPISRGIRNEGDTGAYLLNGRFVLDSTIRKSATVGLVRQCLRVGDITRIERG